MWRKVLAEHQPDHGGRCRECRTAAGESSGWPCQTYRVAEEAKWVGEGNLPGTGPHGPGPGSSPRVSPPERSSPGSDLGSSRSFDDDPLTGSSWAVGSAWDDRGAGYGSSGYDLGGPGHGRSGYDRPSYNRPTSDRHPLDRSPLDGPGLPPGPIEPGFPSGRRRRAEPDAPYGSTVDAPYGSSFGVDDGRHSSRR